MKKQWYEIRAALWQGLVMLLAVLVLFGSAYTAVYWFSWGSNPHWLEAFHDRWKLWNLPDNRFWLWIHQDSQYWTVRVRFDKGPIVLEGLEPDALYWSIAYYPVTEPYTITIDTASANLDGQGRYRITMDPEVENSLDEQTIKVAPGVKRGIVELRVTVPDPRASLVLPSVTQDGRLLIAEGQP
jgi:hypothetical protein